MHFNRIMSILSNKLIEVWQREGQIQEGKSKEERLMLARCLIAKHCLYGVDKNPRAVELARWSLWLAMENPDIPLDNFDQNLKYGDAVVGCTVEQISVFDWSQKDNTQSKLNPLIQKIKTQRLKVLEERVVDAQNILKHIESISHQAKRTGDLLVACIWAGGSRVQVQKRIKRIRLEISQLLRGDFSEEATHCSMILITENLDSNPFIGSWIPGSLFRR